LEKSQNWRLSFRYQLSDERDQFVGLKRFAKRRYVGKFEW